MKKLNRILLAILLVLTIGVVGLTIAYFSNSITIENEFQTNDYGTTVVEEFVSPDNWTPGSTTDKTLIVTNSGNVDEAVRVEVTESWVSKNGDPLPLKQNGNDAAIMNLANISDWTKISENNKTYYYYNYKLAPTESTSTLLNSVTFNPLVTNDTNCQESEANGVKTVICNSTGDGYDGATYTLTFKIETVQYDKYAEAWGTNVEVLAEKPHPGIQYLLDNATNPANAEYSTETKGKMFYFTHTLNEGTENEEIITEARYIGDEPKNYVYFNCDDMSIQNSNTCEVWRILGVFDVDDGTGNVEQRMKLVRGNEFANTMFYNSSANNDWTVSSLKTYLNEDYYSRIGDAATYGLKTSARDLIDEAKYYLGAFNWSDSDATYTTEYIYTLERGSRVCGACNSDTTKLTWTGIVGLMYPSDFSMTYAKTDELRCYNHPMMGCEYQEKSWIFNTNILEGSSGFHYQSVWFLSPVANFSNQAFDSDIMNSLNRGKVNIASLGVRPVVYLKSSIQIVDGDGSLGNPYKLQ